MLHFKIHTHTVCQSVLSCLNLIIFDSLTDRPTTDMELGRPVCAYAQLCDSTLFPWPLSRPHLWGKRLPEGGILQNFDVAIVVWSTRNEFCRQGEGGGGAGSNMTQPLVIATPHSHSTQWA